MGKLTKRTIDSLTTPSQGDKFYWDEELKGLGIKVYSSGKKSFVFQYRNLSGQTKRLTLGTYGKITPELARDLAKEHAAKIASGHDPVEEKHKKKQEAVVNIKISVLAEEYFKAYAEANKRSSSLKEDKGLVRLYILPAFGNVHIQDLTPKMVEDWKVSMRDKPYRANRTLALLSKMYSLAIRWRWVERHPIKGIEKYQEHKRDRWLQEEELTKLCNVLDKYPECTAANLIKMLILTGSRLGETTAATWEQFDLERGIWVKPSHLTKQKKVEYTPLSQTAINFLETLKQDAQGSYLFPGRVPNKPLVNVYAFWKKLLKEANIENIRIHDLRHTYASHLVSSGLSLSIVGKLLGHTQAATTQRYAHLADQALRDATNVFGNKIANLKKNGNIAQES